MDSLYYLARISDFRDQYERAVRYYSEVKYGSNTVFSQQRASYLMAHELDDVEGAFLLLDEFADLSPGNAIEVVSMKAQLLVSLERYEEGLALFDKAIKYRPDNQGLVLGRAELTLRIGHLEEAIQAYRSAVKRWPESSMALNALGYTLADQTDQFKEAEKLIRKAIELDPNNPAIIDSLGWVLFKLGQHEEGLGELQRAYAIMDDHEVGAHVVEVLSVLGRVDEALELLEAAEKKDPDSQLLKDVRERYFPE